MPVCVQKKFTTYHTVVSYVYVLNVTVLVCMCVSELRNLGPGNVSALPREPDVFAVLSVNRDPPMFCMLNRAVLPPFPNCDGALAIRRLKMLTF